MAESILLLLRDTVHLVIGDGSRAVVGLVVLALLDEVGCAGAVVDVGGIDVGGQNVLLLVDVLEEEPLRRSRLAKEAGDEEGEGKLTKRTVTMAQTMAGPPKSQIR